MSKEKFGVTFDLGHGTKATFYEGLKLNRRHIDMLFNQGATVGWNDCRNQTLQAISNLKV